MALVVISTKYLFHHPFCCPTPPTPPHPHTHTHTHTHTHKTEYIELHATPCQVGKLPVLYFLLSWVPVDSGCSSARMINGSALRLSRSLISVCTGVSSSDPTPSLNAATLSFAFHLLHTLIPTSFLLCVWKPSPPTLPVTGPSSWPTLNCCGSELCHSGSCCIVSGNSAYGTWTGKWVCEDAVSVWLQRRVAAAHFIWEYRHCAFSIPSHLAREQHFMV